MPVVTFQPDGKSVHVREGMTLLQSARAAGVYVRSRCDGIAGCLMCKVTVQQGAGVSQASAAERRKLGDRELNKGVRLACQTKALAECEVIVPEDPLRAAVRKQLELQKEEDELW